MRTKKNKPIIKYNNGAGAILCLDCNVIIKENLTAREFAGDTDLLYCNDCKAKRSGGQLRADL